MPTKLTRTTRLWVLFADNAKAQKLAAGSFFAFDPGLAHFAHVEEETVVQLSSTGPWTINYVSPADDPRQKK